MTARPKQMSNITHLIQTSHGPFSFSMTRSSGRKTVAISIGTDADVRVLAPSRIEEKEIYAIVHGKMPWIRKKVEEIRKHNAGLSKKRFESGEKFLFLGQEYPLLVNGTSGQRGRTHFDGSQWTVFLPLSLPACQHAVAVKKKMIQWYRTQAQEILGGRIFHYSRLVGKEPKKITVRTQKRLWGSCHFSTQAVYLNWQIVLSPLEMVDYVVVHELCHLLVPDHSAKFWKKVEALIPDFRRRRQWLKDHAWAMKVF
jgi:predicted metal-dependent hydrolase